MQGAPMIARSTMDMWVFRLRAESLFGVHLDGGRRQDADLVAPRTPDVITLREEDGVWLSQGETSRDLSAGKNYRLPYSPTIYDGAGRLRVAADPKGMAVDLFA
jgi:hypothetical protein